MSSAGNQPPASANMNGQADEGVGPSTSVSESNDQPLLPTCSLPIDSSTVRGSVHETTVRLAHTGHQLHYLRSPRLLSLHAYPYIYIYNTHT